MSKLLVLCAALAQVARGADVRALLRQRLEAATSAVPDWSCSPSVKTGPLASICTEPAGVVYTNQGCGPQIFTWNPSMALYVQVCGTAACTYSDTIKADFNVGGQPCTGNKNIAVTAPGVLVGGQCAPCLDAIMTTPADPLNAAACGLSNSIFGCAVNYSVKAYNEAADFAGSVADDVASGAVNTYNKANEALDKTGKVLSSAGKSTGGAIKKGFKKIG